MKALLISVLLLMPLSASSAGSDRPVLDKFAMAVLVVPVALYVVGEFWTRVCEGAGYEYGQDEQGFWACSGFPFKAKPVIPARQGDFFECAPGRQLVVCPVGETPTLGECKNVGSGATTLTYGTCS